MLPEPPILQPFASMYNSNGPLFCHHHRPLVIFIKIVIALQSTAKISVNDKISNIFWPTYVAVPPNNYKTRLTTQYTYTRQINKRIELLMYSITRGSSVINAILIYIVSTTHTFFKDVGHDFRFKSFQFFTFIFTPIYHALIYCIFNIHRFAHRVI